MIRKSYVDTSDGQMHYRYTEGGSGPPIVFFHMTASSSEAYVRIMELLDGHFPLIAFDTVNYGESFRTTVDPSIPYIADVMLEALTNLGIDKFHTYGHHTGVSIQVEMAAKAPDRVVSTIQNGATYANPETMEAFRERVANPNPANVKGTQIMWAWSRIKDCMQITLAEDPPHAARIMHRDTVDMLRAGDNWHWAYQAVFAHDLPQVMKQVKCPIFFVCGTKDLSYPVHMAAVADYPDSPSFLFEGGGVYFVETHAEVLAPHLIEFVEGVNAKNG